MYFPGRVVWPAAGQWPPMRDADFIQHSTREMREISRILFIRILGNILDVTQFCREEP